MAPKLSNLQKLDILSFGLDPELKEHESHGAFYFSHVLAKVRQRYQAVLFSGLQYELHHRQEIGGYPIATHAIFVAGPLRMSHYSADGQSFVRFCSFLPRSKSSITNMTFNLTQAEPAQSEDTAKITLVDGLSHYDLALIRPETGLQVAIFKPLPRQDVHKRYLEQFAKMYGLEFGKDSYDQISRNHAQEFIGPMRVAVTVKRQDHMSTPGGSDILLHVPRQNIPDTMGCVWKNDRYELVPTLKQTRCIDEIMRKVLQ
jgi:hypothetical protein